jgi:integrase/recombinase XerD
VNVQLCIDFYVARRRSAGLEFCSTEKLLQRFAESVRDLVIGAIAEADVTAFLNSKTAGVDRSHKVRGTLRDFFAYCFAMGFIPSVPMPRTQTRRDRCFSPFIYSRPQIRSLLQAAFRCQEHFNCVIRAETLRSFLLFLYGTGLRVGVATGLKLNDADLLGNVVRVPSARGIRWLPINDTLSAALGQYVNGARNQNAASDHLFATRDGRPILLRTIDSDFARLRRLAGIARHDGALRQPRIHDLRHTFAVHSISDWHEQGADVNELLPILAEYMGSFSVAKCDRYLKLTPSSFWPQLEKLSIDSTVRPDAPIG